MASGLDMLYNAIGGAGSTLSGHLRESELARLQVEAELRAQAERDALLERTNRELADFDKKYSDTKSQAQDLGMQLPAPGSIDDQIFRATGGFGFTPNPRMSLGQTTSPAQGGGTQIPVSTPRTEWAPSQAEAAVSADAIRATKELLSGKSAIDTDRFFKRLELVQGAQRRAASRPSTSGMSATLGDQAKGLSDFMTREGAIANDGRQLQGSIASRFMDNRALSARDRQGTEYVQGQTNARNAAGIASAERIANARDKKDEAKQARMEDKETRLQQNAAREHMKILKGEIKSAQEDEVKVISGAMEIDDFKRKYPHAEVENPFWGSPRITKRAVRDDLVKQVEYLDQYLTDSEIELARRTGTASATPENAALRAAAGNVGGFPGIPPASASGAKLKNLNKSGKTLDGI